MWRSGNGREGRMVLVERSDVLEVAGHGVVVAPLDADIRVFRRSGRVRADVETGITVRPDPASSGRSYPLDRQKPREKIPFVSWSLLERERSRLTSNMPSRSPYVTDARPSSSPRVSFVMTLMMPNTALVQSSRSTAPLHFCGLPCHGAPAFSTLSPRPIPSSWSNLVRVRQRL